MEINRSKIEVVTPGEASEAIPPTSVEDPKPPPPAPPVMATRSEVHEANMSRSPAQTNVNKEPASGSANKGG